jgi:hypothetical protein
MAEFEVARLYAVTKISPVSGNQHVMTFLLSPKQWEEIQPFLDKSLPKGRFIQDILPHHTPQEREFLISGTTQEEWDELWGQDPASS